MNWSKMEQSGVYLFWNNKILFHVIGRKSYYNSHMIQCKLCPMKYLTTQEMSNILDNR